MTITHLRKYAKYITVGLQNESAEEHADWKKQLTDFDASSAAPLETLERPNEWDELFRAMNELSFTQSDVLEHCRYLDYAGEHTLASAVRQAIDSEPSFKYMERG